MILSQQLCAILMFFLRFVDGVVIIYVSTLLHLLDRFSLCYLNSLNDNQCCTLYFTVQHVKSCSH